jgi:ATP-dependent DNA helicase RecG
MLRFADLAQDQDLLAWAQRTAPRLLASHPQAAQAQVQRWLGHQAAFLRA